MDLYCPVHRQWMPIPDTANPPHRCHLMINVGVKNRDGSPADERCNTELINERWIEVDPDKLDDFIAQRKAQLMRTNG